MDLCVYNQFLMSFSCDMFSFCMFVLYIPICWFCFVLYFILFHTLKVCFLVSDRKRVDLCRKVVGGGMRGVEGGKYNKTLNVKDIYLPVVSAFVLFVFRRCTVIAYMK